MHFITTYTRLLGVAVALALALSTAPAAAAGGAAHGYRLGVFPYMAPRQTIEFYGPLAKGMAGVLGKPVHLESSPSFSSFTRAISEGAFDIALIQPFDYPDIVEKRGYKPLAQLAVPLTGQIYVRADSDYKTLQDLRGTVVAMPPAVAANARMALRALKDNGLIPGRDIEVRYFNSHEACLQQVWIGDASACGTALPPVTIFEKRTGGRMRAIHDVPTIPHILFVAHPRVPAEDSARVAAYLTGLGDSDAGRAILKGLGFPGFTAHRPADYAVMRTWLNEAPAAQATETQRNGDLLLGVFPYLPSRQLAEHLAPVLPAMAKVLERPVQLRSAASFDNFLDGLAGSAYDIVLVQPFDYAIAIEHGYVPLVRVKDDIKTAIFVLAASPYQRVTDLKGQVVAMPPEMAAVSRIGRATLAAAGLVAERDYTVNYRASHDSCLQQLQNKDAAACVTSTLALAILRGDPLVRGLRTIGDADVVPGMVFMAHQRLPAKSRQALAAAMLSWDKSEDGRKLLTALRMGTFAPFDKTPYLRLHTAERAQ